MSIDPEIDSQIVNRAKWAASSRHGTIHDSIIRIGQDHTTLEYLNCREQGNALIERQFTAILEIGNDKRRSQTLCGGPRTYVTAAKITPKRYEAYPWSGLCQAQNRSLLRLAVPARSLSMIHSYRRDTKGSILAALWAGM